MGALFDKIGNRDQSDLRDQIYSIFESPIFELYSTEQRIKATMYGTRASDVELAAARKLAETWPSGYLQFVMLVFSSKMRRLEALIMNQSLHMKYHFLLQQENSVEFFKRTQSSVFARERCPSFQNLIE
ncbi:hypothetical protein H5410_063617, partial [Solanum commersonii]